MNFKEWLMKNSLLFFTLVAVVIGAFFGFYLRSYNFSNSTITAIGFPGDIFMRMLQMMVLPLILCSIINGLATLDSKSSGRIFVISFIYYGLTTIFAAFLGVALVITVKPGKYFGNRPQDYKAGKFGEKNPKDAVFDLIRNAFPDNIIQAMAQQYQTQFDYGYNGTMHSKPGYINGMNVVGMVVFSVVVGIIVGRMGEKAKLMSDLLSIVDKITMKVVMMIMWYSPIGIMSLIMSNMLEVDDLRSTFTSLGLYMAVVSAGQFTYLLFVLPLLYTVITRKNPLVFMAGIMEAMITALITSSSAATLPFSIKCCEENLHMDKRVTRFVLPVGSTINMNGTALYEAISTIFIAQINKVQLTAAKLAILSITATVASMGAAAVPGSGIVETVIVLNSVGLPPEDIGIVIGVDFILDRLRTAVNVVGDAYGAGIINHLCKNKLDFAKNCTKKGIVDAKDCAKSSGGDEKQSKSNEKGESNDKDTLSKNSREDDSKNLKTKSA